MKKKKHLGYMWEFPSLLYYYRNSINSISVTSMSVRINKGLLFVVDFLRQKWKRETLKINTFTGKSARMPVRNEYLY